jgi:cobalamin biosynthesis Mg chelatase CobN
MPDQKQRMRFLVERVMPMLSAAVDTRRSETYDVDDNDVNAYFGGPGTANTVGIAPR